MADSICHLSTNVSMILKTEILSAEILDSLKQMIILKSFNSLVFM